MFFGPDGSGLPDEIAAALKEQMERADMHAESTRHDVIRMFEELSVEHLVILRTLFHHCAGEESGRYASHLEGYISGTLHFKHEVCVACGVNHNDPSTLVGDEKIDDGTKQPTLFEEPDSKSDQMEENGVREPVDEDYVMGLRHTSREKPVICKNCEQLFQSLEDRMLRPPGVKGCEGCQHKAKFG